MASILNAAHIPERSAIAGFILDAASAFAANPFSRTSAATVRYVWGAQTVEFRALNAHAAGLTGLLAGVSDLNGSEPLVQEILDSGPYTLNTFHRGDGCWIVGAVLSGKPGISLPELPIPRTRPIRHAQASSSQVDLFAATRQHT